MKVLGAAIALLAWLASPLGASSQTWQPLKNQPTFPVGAIALLTDGTVLLHEEQDSNPQHWYKLTPDNTGSYVNGTIEPIASLPTGMVLFSSLPSYCPMAGTLLRAENTTSAPPTGRTRARSTIRSRTSGPR